MRAHIHVIAPVLLGGVPLMAANAMMLTAPLHEQNVLCRGRNDNRNTARVQCVRFPAWVLGRATGGTIRIRFVTCKINCFLSPSMAGWRAPKMCTLQSLCETARISLRISRQIAERYAMPRAGSAVGFHVRSNFVCKSVVNRRSLNEVAMRCKIEGSGNQEEISMRNTRKVISLMVAVIIVMALSTAVVAQQKPETKKAAAQGKSSGTAKAQKMRGAGPDENIKNDERKVNPDQQVAAPPSKGGDKTRGERACRIVVDNWTKYPVDIYADGDYRGSVAAFGDGVLYSGNGEVQLYGRTPFTDGTVSTFGPSAYICVNAGIQWKLSN